MGNDKSLVDAKPQATSLLIIGIIMSVVGHSFQYGYNIAVMNAPADEMQAFFFKTCANVTADNTTTGEENSSADPNNSENCYTESMVNLWWSIAIAAFPGSGAIGSLLVGPLVGRFGRRGSFLVTNAISVLAALCFGASKFMSSFYMVILGRFLIGIFAGAASGIVPMYIGEISPKQWRGAFGVLNQLLITIGILVAQVFGLSGVLGNDTMWPILLAFTCVPSILSCVSIPFMPKSPRFLLIDQQNEGEARNLLVKLRGTDDVSDEMDEMRAEAQAQAQCGQWSIPQLFKAKTVRWQLITILLMMAAQQLSGINAVFFYSNMIFDKAGIPKGNPQDLASIGVGTVNVIMTIISVAIIEKTGRKKLLTWGFGMMVFWCVALTVILKILFDMQEADSWISYLSIACVIGYIVGFAIGPGPIPWLITAELFEQAARPPAVMVSCMLNWACNFCVGIGFPAVQEATEAYVFLIFMVICIAATVYLQIYLPETKGKTFKEISNLFAARNGVEASYVGGTEEVKIPLRNMGGSEDV